jgi:ankyrin repeat protein
VTAASIGSAAAQAPELPVAARLQKFADVRELVRRPAVSVDAAEKDGTTALHWAVHWDRPDIVALLLRAGAKPNVATDYGVTPLMLAAMNGNGRVAAELIKAGADTNVALSTGETALMWASRSGSAEAVKQLLAHGAAPEARENVRGQTAVMWAAARNHPDVIRLLADAGADVHARSARGFTALLFAAREGAVDAARALDTAGADVNESLPNKASALLVAAASGHTAVARWLIQRGADVNAADDVGMRPLHAAFFRQKADPDLVQLLLAHGADPNARLTAAPEPLPSEIGSYAPLVGATPFIMAARSLDVDMMRLLAGSGADVRAASANGTTALMVAAGMGRFLTEGPPNVAAMVPAVTVAIELGADITAATEAGQTALHGAASAGANPVIELLAAKGALLQAKDRTGRTARDLAERAVRDGGPETTVDLLRKLGG